MVTDQGCLPNSSLLQRGKKRQGRAWTRQEENLHGSCSQWQQLSRHENGHGERARPAWHFHLSHAPCSFWNSLSWWRGQSYFNPHVLFCFCSWLNCCKDCKDAGILHPYPVPIVPEFLFPVVICKIKQLTILPLSLSLQSAASPSLCANPRFLSWKAVRNVKNWVIKRALDQTF